MRHSESCTVPRFVDRGNCSLPFTNSALNDRVRHCARCIAEEFDLCRSVAANHGGLKVWRGTERKCTLGSADGCGKESGMLVVESFLRGGVARLSLAGQGQVVDKY